MPDLGHLALGAWSGGRFMHFGQPLDDDRLVGLLRPDEEIHTLVTADVYGQGEADRVVGRAIAGLARDSFQLVGMVGHDHTTGTRQGAKGYPRFTDPALRGPTLRRRCPSSDATEPPPTPTSRISITLPRIGKPLSGPPM